MRNKKQRTPEEQHAAYEKIFGEPFSAALQRATEASPAHQDLRVELQKISHRALVAERAVEANEARIARLNAALRSVEYINGRFGDQEESQCPSCGGASGRGHNSDCVIYRALAAEPDAHYLVCGFDECKHAGREHYNLAEGYGACQVERCPCIGFSR